MKEKLLKTVDVSSLKVENPNFMSNATVDGTPGSPAFGNRTTCPPFYNENNMSTIR